MPFPSAGDVGKLHQDHYPDQPKQNQESAGAMRPMSTDERIGEMFAYKSMNSEQNAKALNVRLAATNFAKVIAHNLYGGTTQERAIRKIHEISMICNWAISRER